MKKLDDAEKKLVDGEKKFDAAVQSVAKNIDVAVKNAIVVEDAIVAKVDENEGAILSLWQKIKNFFSFK